MADIQKTREEMRRKGAAFRGEVMDKMSALATAAFGLVAALAWNNAIQAVFKRFYPAPDDPAAIGPLIGYAVLITLVAVLIILWIGRVAARLKGKAAAEAAKA
jgi:hypothetical protein